MKTAVLVSGGVDSSVALRLLRDEGSQDLTAFYLKVWLEDELAFLGDCPWETDLGFVRAVCDEVGVPLQVVSLQSEYLEKVVGYTLEELKAGRTPSPDVLCNQRIKFGEFFSKMGDGYDRVATGHYAQVDEQDGRCLLRRSPDRVKDQTYFLSHLSQEQLRRAQFPIGHLTKPCVRQLACEFDLPTQSRAESQGICFLGKIRYSDFVRYHLGERPGNIVEQRSGKVLGRHRGYWYYTIGQRQGLGLSGGPWYVSSKDTGTNTVYVVHQIDRMAWARNAFSVSGLNWISGVPTKADLQVKVRHGPHLSACRIGDVCPDRISVVTADRDPGIAPGQFAVFYDGEICLGGGVID